MELFLDIFLHNTIDSSSGLSQILFARPNLSASSALIWFADAIISMALPNPTMFRSL